MLEHTAAVPPQVNESPTQDAPAVGSPLARLIAQPADPNMQPTIAKSRDV